MLRQRWVRDVPARGLGFPYQRARVRAAPGRTFSARRSEIVEGDWRVRVCFSKCAAPPTQLDRYGQRAHRLVDEVAQLGTDRVDVTNARIQQALPQGQPTAKIPITTRAGSSNEIQ